MSLRDDLLRGYTAKLAELRRDSKAREPGKVRHRDLDATNRWGGIDPKADLE